MVQKILLLIVIVILLVTALVYSQRRPGVEQTSGFIEADEIRLGSRVGGRVARVQVKEGEDVIQGQVLIELEPYDLRAREQEAKATLAAKEAEYKRLVDGFREEEVEQARARVRKACAQLDQLIEGPREQEIEATKGRLEAAVAEQKLAQQQYDRTTTLRRTDAIPQSELDTATEAVNTATAMVGVRSQELALLQAGTRPEEIRQAEAVLDEARAAQKIAETGYQLMEVEQARGGQLKIRGCVNSGFFRFSCRLSADGVGQFCSLGLDRGAEFCLIPCFDVLTDTYVIASRMTGGVVTPNRAAQMRIKLVKPLRL